jgi:signal transduction histidine kinase
MDTYTQAFDRREYFQMEYRLRRHDGQYRWLSAIGVPRFNPDHSFAGYIGSCTDVTEHKLAEESLADMGRKLIEAHEEERTWIARELHDDVNQRMALLAIELDRWNQQLPPSAVEFHDHIHHASQRLSEIAKDIQALSHRLILQNWNIWALWRQPRASAKSCPSNRRQRLTSATLPYREVCPRKSRFVCSESYRKLCRMR